MASIKSLRSRNKRAGFQAGFFGQLNENAARKATQADNIARMVKKAGLERAQSSFDRAEKARLANEARRNQAVDNNRDPNGLRAAAFQSLAAAPGWKQMSKKAQDAAINSKVLSDEALINKKERINTRDRAMTDDLNTRSAAAMNTQISGGLPEDSQVSPISGATAEPAIQDLRGVGITPGTPGAPEQAGQLVDPLLADLPGSINDDLRAIPVTAIHGSGFTSTDPKTGEQKINFVDEAGKLMVSHSLGQNVRTLSQANRTYVDDRGELVTALFDKEDKRGIFTVDQSTGRRNYDIIPETDADASKRVERSGSRRQQQELFTNALSGVASASQLLDGRNVANLGVQGMWNQFAEFAGTLVNPFQTVEEGKELTKEVKEALGVPVNLTGSEAQEAAESRKKSILRKLTLDNLGFDTAQTDEERGEIQALANKAATDVRMASLVYYAAKTFRGAGKLNTDDLARIDRIVSVSAGEGSFQGGVREIQADLYGRAKRMSGTLINGKWAGVGNKIQNGIFMKDPQGARAPGFLFEVIQPGLEEPEIVFINADTGGAVGMTLEQAEKFTANLEVVQDPSRIAPQR